MGALYFGYNMDVLREAKELIKVVYCVLALLLSLTVCTQEKVNKVTCIMSGARGSCQIDVGEVIHGEVIRPWAKIKNIGTSTIKVKEIVSYGPPGWKPLDALLSPGQEVIYELLPTNTANFTGDICKTHSYKMDPPGKLEVTLYRSKEDLENDQKEMKEGEEKS